MMIGIEKIKDTIISDSEDKAREVLQDGEAQVAAILAEAKKLCQEKEAALGKVMDYEKAQTRKIMLSMAELEMRNDILFAKQDIIDKVFAEAVVRLNSMNKERYQDLIKTMLMTSVEAGDEEILFSKAGVEKLPEDFVAKINQELANKGMKGQLTVSSETPNIDGGFIIRNKGVEINNSFSALVNVYRDELETEVAAVLF
jgi:V/A-type H+-transporting ATPase subunit E